MVQVPNSAPQSAIEFARPTDDELSEAGRRVVHGFSSAGVTIACAESLTAGLLSATVATVPGASAVLRGGVVVYATELKASLGGVPREVLDADGAVAPTTARYLAAHVREACGATLGVALTGVAGPEPQEGKPVGQVFIGLADGTKATAQLAGNVLFRHNYADKQATSDILIGGDRETIRRSSVSAALSSCSDWLAEFDVDRK